MSETQSQFEKAAKDVQSLSEKPSNEDLLQLYSYYKQATEGDTKGARPGLFDVKGRAKFDAWAKVKGLSVDDAMKKYINLVQKLQGR